MMMKLDMHCLTGLKIVSLRGVTGTVNGEHGPTVGCSGRTSSRAIRNTDSSSSTMSTVSGPVYPPAGSRPLSQASTLARSPPSTASPTADRAPLGLDAAARSISSSSSTLTLRPGTNSAVQAAPTSGLRTPSNRKTVYDRNLNRSRNAELSKSSFAYLFSEMVVYAQRRVTGIQDLEKR